MCLTWRIKGSLYEPSFPMIMGILNVTPDSFFVGSRVSQTSIQGRAEAMIRNGARILDIGGASSRPGSVIVPLEEELKRVLPAIRSIKAQFPDTLISIDTWRAEVAKASVEAGADLVNDISAGKLDDAMFSTVAKLGVPYILMHMQGTPPTMQQAPTYEDVAAEVTLYLSQRARQAHDAGISDVIIDPGFGFGKTLEQNHTLFDALPRLKQLGYPLLIGISRKSMVWKAEGSTADKALPGTIKLHERALEMRVDILRVHDVKEAVALIRQ